MIDQIWCHITPYKGFGEFINICFVFIMRLYKGHKWLKLRECLASQLDARRTVEDIFVVVVVFQQHRLQIGNKLATSAHIAFPAQVFANFFSVADTKVKLKPRIRTEYVISCRRTGGTCFALTLSPRFAGHCCLTSPLSPIYWLFRARPANSHIHCNFTSYPSPDRAPPQPLVLSAFCFRWPSIGVRSIEIIQIIVISLINDFFCVLLSASFANIKSH